jgi:type IV secretory pathway TrbL component
MNFQTTCTLHPTTTFAAGVSSVHATLPTMSQRAGPTRQWHRNTVTGKPLANEACVRVLLLLQLPLTVSSLLLLLSLMIYSLLLVLLLLLLLLQALQPPCIPRC